MRCFDETLIANHPREHGVWWADQCVEREYFHQTEDHFASLQNAASVLPRDAWLDMDNITRRVMRADEGSVWMNDLMPLAKPVNIGKLVHLNRVSSEPPEIMDGFEGWYDDFWSLSTERQIGFGIGPIPQSEIDRRCAGWGYEDVEMFEHCIREMDRAYMKHQNKTEDTAPAASPRDAFRGATAGRRK